MNTSIGLVLPADGTPVKFKVAGQTVSTAMGDATIVATAGSNKFKKNGTVYTVTVTFLYLEDKDKTVEGDPVDDKQGNNTKENYFKFVDPNTYLLGPRKNALIHGWAFLAIGKVEPNTFAEDIVLERNVQGRVYSWEPGQPGKKWLTELTMDFPLNPTPETFIPDNRLNPNDTGKPGKTQDRNPQSKPSKGFVYDWDVPGVFTKDLTWPKDSILSMRANFYMFASVLDKGTDRQVR